MTHRLIAIFVVAIAITLPAAANDRGADTTRDIVKMHDAGVSDAMIYDYFASGAAVDLTSDDIAYLTRAGISDRLLRDLLDMSGGQRQSAARTTTAPFYSPYYGSSYDPYYGSYPYWFYSGLGHLHFAPGFGDHNYGHGYGHGGGHPLLPHLPSPFHPHGFTHSFGHAFRDVGRSAGHAFRHAGGGLTGSHGGGSNHSRAGSHRGGSHGGGSHGGGSHGGAHH